MNVSQAQLTSQDKYVLARAFMGLPTDDLDCSPPIRMVIGSIDFQSPDGFKLARQIFASVMPDIAGIDPNGPPPTIARPRPTQAAAYVPALPDAARLSDAALAAMESSNEWYHAARQWIVTRSPMTPPHFLSTGLIWVLGLTINRRVCIEFHDRIYPTLYALLIAETSRYAKSTGLSALYSLVESAMPHMLMPGQTTPEGLIELMAGNQPSNYDKLPRRDQQLIDEGRKFAAQRGIILDEFSSLLGSHKKDYMQGFVELLMRLYDSRDLEMHYSKSGGMLIIRWPGLSILGATTPAAMARAVTTEMWENGANARYLMMFREDPLPYNANYIGKQPPPEIIGSLVRLYNALPKITPNDELESGTSFTPLYAQISQDALAMYRAYTRAVYNDMVDDDLDPRLYGNYKRLHIQALKMALATATMDWVTRGTDTVRIEAGHWALGQSLAETAREGLHRLMPVLSLNEDARIQRDILGILKHTQLMTVRDIVRLTGRSTKDVRVSLDVLIEAGEVEQVEHRPGTGRPTYLYRSV